MTDGHDEDQDTHEPSGARPTPPREGVRIIGAEEAQAALDSGLAGRRIAESDVIRLSDEPEVAVIAVDELVAVRIHPAVPRRPGEVGIADVGIVGIASVEDGRQRSIPNLRNGR